MRPRTLLSFALVLAATACAGETGTDQESVPASPAAAPSPTQASTGTSGAEPAGTVLARGDFERIGYDGQGEVSMVESDDGTEVRFRRFQVEQGPALRVYLSEASAGSPEERYDDDFVDLGELEAFSGDQTYAVPGGTELDAYRSVVIWCEEFGVGFVVAPLDPA